MAWDEELDGMKKLAVALGMKALQNVTENFDPDKLIENAKDGIATSLKDTILEILSDPDDSTTSNILDRLFERLDDSDVIAAIAKPLAESFQEHIKENSSQDLATAIVNELSIDRDEIIEAIANKIAQRIALPESIE